MENTNHENECKNRSENVKQVKEPFSLTVGTVDDIHALRAVAEACRLWVKTAEFETEHHNPRLKRFVLSGE